MNAPAPTPTPTFKDDFASVQGHLTTMQGVVNRMATNSASVKAWCVSLVAAILVLVGDKNKPALLWITVVPIGLFFWLDAYYLMLEQGFRGSYRTFVTKLHRGSLVADDLYEIKPDKGGLKGWASAACSPSVLPVYAVIALMVLLAWFMIKSESSTDSEKAASVETTSSLLIWGG